MKKLLLSLAVVLGLGSTFNATAAEPTLTQQWVYGAEGWGDGWDGTAPNWSSTDAIKAQSCTRFATAKDGKIYLLNMKTMSIAQLTADGVQDLYKLPSLEGQEYNGVADYYGTAITVDEVGNFLIGHFFTKAPQCVLRYTIYSPSSNKAKTFTFDVPEGMTLKRMDTMGRVLGDLTKNAYAYIAPGANAGNAAIDQRVRIIKFTGDGDVDNVTAEQNVTSRYIYLAVDNTLEVCQPIYNTMAEAAGVPMDATFMSASIGISPTTKALAATFFGFTAAGGENWGYSGLGGKASTATAGFDTFTLGGKHYYCLNYLETYDEAKNSPMSVAIFDAEFNKVADWTNADYTSAAGYSSIIAEPVDDNNANIYIFNSTGNVNGEKKNYGCGAMLKFSLEAEPVVADNVLFQDDFEWLAPWAAAGNAGSTVETDNPNASAPQVVKGDALADGITAEKAIENKGYQLIGCYNSKRNPGTPGQQIYTQTNYLKFGKTGYYSGLVLPAFENVPAGAVATISFDWCSMRQGSGKWDPTELVVIVKNGDVEDQYLVPTHTYADNDPYAWLTVSVALENSAIKDGTTITIRNIDDQWPSAGNNALRYFLDNIKVTYEIAPEGTKLNPYKITTPAELADMRTKVAANTTARQYFVLENDLDMAGITDYVPTIGADGATYVGEFDFDGQNHVIRNFAPEAKYSYMSLFGVIRGNVRNLGVENANITSNSLGAAVFGGYASQGGVDCVLENCWATGTVKGNGCYAGGLAGTNGNNLTIKNCYFNGDVISSNYAGGLVGRARAGLTIENAYAAGEVSGATNAGGIAGTDKTGLTVTLNNVVAWNTAVSGAAAAAVTTLDYNADGVKVWNGLSVNGQVDENGATADELTALVTSWEGWHKALKDGYPALAWEDVKAPLGTEGNPFVIATAEDLANLKAQLSATEDNYVVFEADVDMAGVAFAPFCPTAGKEDANMRTIHIDGKNHVIKNLSMNTGGASLVGYLHGSIKNLGLENITATAGSWDPAGAFACYAYHEATLENCWATGAVTGFYAAGLVGGVQSESSLTIKNCYSTATATSPNGYAAGLVGPCNVNAKLTIENAYAAGAVSAQNVAGGISAGRNTTSGYEGAVITLKNVLTFCPSIKATAAEGVVANSDMEGVTITMDNALVSDATLVNDSPVEGATSKFDLITYATGWEGWNELLLNGMPCLAWQEGNEALLVLSTADDVVAMKGEILPGVNTIVLLNDIDMTGVAFSAPDINGKVVNFDGQGHVIKNLTVNGNGGLFLNFNGTIRNLGMENVSCEAGGWGTAGGIVAYMMGESVIENCYTTGTVNGFYAGGIAAGVQSGANATIRNCYSLCEVKGGTQAWGGGIVGPVNQNAALTIENCYAAGNINTNNGAGGIAAGGNFNYAEPATLVIKNSVALNPSVTAADTNVGSYVDANNVNAIAPSLPLVVPEITDCHYVNTMTLKGVAVEGGEEAEALKALIAEWEGWKLDNGNPVLAWQASTEVPEPGPDGSAEHPYELATAEDLCNMHNLMVDGKKVYIVMTADIDMEGVADYVPAIGSDGMSYVGEFDFDGREHVIKNFAPDDKYYYQSIFGVVRGTVRNLGIENCDVFCTKSGTGVLGGYAGHNGIKAEIDNVWATGTVASTSYTGGLVGNAGDELTITNSYFNGTVEGGNFTGGLVGRVRGNVTMKNVYAAGVVDATGIGAGLVAGTDKEFTITLVDAIAWNTTVDGSSAAAVCTSTTADTNVMVWEGMKVNEEAVTGGVSETVLRETAMAWEAYADYLNNGYPVLKWQPKGPDSAVEAIEAVSTEAAVYYNLQGVRVENPTTGFYIKKQGNKATKVIIR